MSKAIVVGLAVTVVLVLFVAAGLSLAQQGGQAPQGGQAGAGAPTAPMGGPASGPPGMAVPKDIVKGQTPKAPNPARTSKVIWIIVGLVVLGVIVAYVMSRKGGS